MAEKEAILIMWVVSLSPFIASFLMIVCWVVYIIWFKKNPTNPRTYMYLDNDVLDRDLEEFARKIRLDEPEYQEMISTLPETGRPHSH